MYIIWSKWDLKSKRQNMSRLTSLIFLQRCHDESWFTKVINEQLKMKLHLKRNIPAIFVDSRSQTSYEVNMRSSKNTFRTSSRNRRNSLISWNQRKKEKGLCKKTSGLCIESRVLVRNVQALVKRSIMV